MLKRSNRAIGTQTDPVQFSNGEEEVDMEARARTSSVGGGVINSPVSEPKTDEAENSLPERKSSVPVKRRASMGVRLPPVENQMGTYGKPQIMQGEIDEAKLRELHMRLNKIINKFRRKNDGKVNKELETNKLVWTIPSMILYFL